MLYYTRQSPDDVLLPPFPWQLVLSCRTLVQLRLRPLTVTASLIRVVIDGSWLTFFRRSLAPICRHTRLEQIFRSPTSDLWQVEEKGLKIKISAER